MRLVCRHVLSAKFSEAGLGLLDRDHDGTISEEELVGLGKEVRGHALQHAAASHNLRARAASLRTLRSAVCLFAWDG